MGTKQKEKAKRNKEEFKIQVAYEKNGKSFQEVAESILLMKIRNFFWARNARKFMVIFLHR